ncbi:MAG: CcmD family protein [Candidatus Kryptoniota bacterium]
MSSLYTFLNAHSLYVVLGIVLVIWLGIFIYLLWLDKKVNKLYEKIEDPPGGSESEKENAK